MLYYSTNRQSSPVDFREATIKGQAEDKGLYFPETIPAFGDSFIKNIEHLSKTEIGLQVMLPYVGNTIPFHVLENIIAQTVDFNFPLVPVKERISALELFHGPTLAFKDVGARFMSRCLGYFMKGSKQKITVLVATSGDTGGAVAHGFYEVEGVEVILLYPSGKVSSIQELQLTTLGRNITALEIDGTFDDCQHMVKEAFADKELNRTLFLTSANSINVARWLPQQLYYIYAYQQWKEKEMPPVISVPSGNFGNICAGLLAYRSGLPVQHFIAACNTNDVVSDYIHSGSYQPKKAIPTLSNAMDVGDPSNFVRMLRIFEHELPAMQKILTGYTVSDRETKQAIEEVYTRYNYLMDPHGAVGYIALQQYLNLHPAEKGIFLETAHPVKFYDVVEPVIQKKVALPLSVQGLLGASKQSIRIKESPKQLKEFLLDRAKN